MVSRELLVFLCFFLLLSACSTHTLKPVKESKSSETGKTFNVITGKDFCYPVETDAFNHPIDALPVTISDDLSIWPRVQRGLALADVKHPRITPHLRWYHKHPSYLGRVQKRSARYIHSVVELLEKHSLPTDLALLPIVESAYEPFAYSHGQASGLWQFIPITAKRFKLESDWWRDDRRNTLKSTEAAIKYLSYLHRYFDNDWLLAVAAYNAGEGTVRKAIRKNKKRKQPTTFWHLDLPKETRAYVPKLIALSHIIKYPNEYNVELLSIPDEPYFKAVKLGYQLDLAQAATLMDTPIEELYYLNPDLNQWATPPIDNYVLKVPADKKHTLKQALKKLPEEQRINWKRHKVASGESLSLIAQKYNSNTQLIKDVNNLTSSRILKGMKLMIPTAKNHAIEYSYSQSQRLRAKQNRQPGSRKNKINHRVKSGDSLWRIAKKHKISINQLARWNNKSPKDSLRIGEKLVIWQTVKPSSRTEMTRRITYTVRNGDSLARIADKFHVSIKDLVKWNQVNPKKYLKKGQKLKVYVDVSKTTY